MGAYLSTPDLEKETSTKTSKYDKYNITYSATCMQGWRKSQEDAHIAAPIPCDGGDDEAMVFAVFDGHGGKEVRWRCCPLSHIYTYKHKHIHI